MKRLIFGALASVALLGLIAGASSASPIQSYTSVFNGGSLVDFEAYSTGTLISTQYAGVTFGQAPFAGRPQIDTYPYIFAYGASSGSNVLTGSIEGGYSFPTIAGITATFDTPTSDVQAFFSDTAPLGNYTFSAFGAGNAFLESFTVLSTDILPPGYSGGNFPPPGTTPLPGLYVGFDRPTADIYSVHFGPSLADNDAFAIDDLRFGGSTIPEPSTLLLLGPGLMLLGGMVRRRFRK